jgi:hypothetical protein
MSELSEQAFSAGWMKDLEYALWSALTSGPCQYGHLHLATVHIERLRSLSQACGGWIRFDDSAEEVYVPIAQWIAHCAEHTRPKPAP